MGIVDEQEKQAKEDEVKQTEAEKHLMEAQSLYDKQKQMLKDIKDTPGMKEIRRYWEDEKRELEYCFKSKRSNLKELVQVKGRYEEVCGFLTYLDDRLS